VSGEGGEARLCVRLIREGSVYRVEAECEGDRELCAAILAEKERILRRVAEAVAFIERYRKHLEELK